MKPTSGRFAEIERLFDLAVQVSADERAALLDEHCIDASIRREVQALLDEDARLGHAHTMTVEQRLSSAATVLDRRGPGRDMPTTVGRFRVIKLLGQGGMGAVYLARQDKPSRDVALKLIRASSASPKTIRRFEHETEVLGQLRHPGIAQIYDAGTHESPDGLQPYFAMELIDGELLHVHARQQDLGLRERLELFVNVCEAVEHAHQKGIIHRDLKPANILVDRSGQPKILDFGIARVTNSDVQMTTVRTEAHQLIGTVPYMSPEQVSGDSRTLDTRSDVYALGVVLYELLAGKLPYNLERTQIYEAVRVIREEEPQRLSSINTVYRGDVETIVAKALEKNRERRYASAAELAADIRHYLADEPIVARPASTMYQLRKFAKRHKAFVTAAAVVAVTLSVGFPTAMILYFGAERARNQALVEGQKAEQVAAFLSSMLRGVAPSIALGEDTAMLRGILDRTAERVDAELRGHPEAEAEIRVVLGHTYTELDETETAELHLRRALELLEQHFGREDTQYAEALNELGTALWRSGEKLAAEQAKREAHDISRRVNGPDDLLTLRAQQDLGNVLVALKWLDDAEPLLTESLAALRRTQGDDSDLVGVGFNSLANLKRRQGDAEAAEKYYREAMAVHRAALGDLHPNLAVDLHNLASFLSSEGRTEGVAEMLDEALAICESVYVNGHHNWAGMLESKAEFLEKQGQFDAAEKIYRQAVDMMRGLEGKLDTRLSHTLRQLGSMLRRRDRPESEVRPLLEEAVQICRDNPPADGFEFMNALSDLAKLEHGLKNWDAAEALLREAVSRRREGVGKHNDMAFELENLGRLYEDQGRYDDAEAARLEALELQKEILPPDHSELAVTNNGIGLMLQRAGQPERAEPYLREAVERTRRAGGAQGHLATMLDNLGAALRDSGRYEEAEALNREALAINTSLHGFPSRQTMGPLYNLAKTLTNMEAPEKLAECDETFQMLVAEAPAFLRPHHMGMIKLAYGEFLLEHRRFADAESVLAGAHADLLSRFTPTHPHVINNLRALVRLYADWDAAEPEAGHAAKAEPWQQLLDEHAS